MADSNDQPMYLCGGEIDAGEFTLDITSDELPPSEITILLGLQATSYHLRGDTIGRSGHTFNFSRWKLSSGRLDFRGARSCSELFDDFALALPGDSVVWQRIHEKCDAEIRVSLWMRTWNREFDLSASALGELARRRLGLHIDTFLEVDNSTDPEG